MLPIGSLNRRLSKSLKIAVLCQLRHNGFEQSLVVSAGRPLPAGALPGSLRGRVVMSPQLRQSILKLGLVLPASPLVSLKLCRGGLEAGLRLSTRDIV